MTLIAILFLLLISGFLLLNLLYKRSNSYKNELLPYSSVIGKVPKDIKLLTLGSTYALYGFGAYDKLHIKAYSFAMPGQCLEIDSALLHKHSDKMESGATIIFCLAACVAYYRYDMVSNQSVYYKMFNMREIPKISVKAMLVNIFPLFGRNIKKVVKIVRGSKAYADIYEQTGACLSDVTMDKNMKSMADGWIRLFHLEDLKKKSTSDTNETNLMFNTALLKEMLEYCIQQQWKPVIVIPPFSSKLNQYFGNDFINNSLYAMIEKSTSELDIPVLDYRVSEDFQHNYSFFADGGFRLNRIGSTIFIKKVLSDLNAKGYNLNNSTLSVA